MRLRGLLIVALTLVLAGCSWRATQAPQDNYLMHVVLVWLKQPGHAEHRRQIVEASRQLAAIPGVRELRVGPVVSSERAVVEDSYDVALSMRFDDAEALQAYLQHPLHVETVKTRFMPIMQRYQVIDFGSP